MDITETGGQQHGAPVKGGGRFCPPGRWEDKEMRLAFSLSRPFDKWTEMSTLSILPTTSSYTQFP